MTAVDQRSALSALDTARPLVERLDVARDPEDVAADLIDAWSAAETALRALIGGSGLSGQALVRELRQRELLSLDQAHVLLEFLAARDRVRRTEYRPTSADVAAAREGFHKLDERLLAPQLQPASLTRPAVPGATPAPPTASAPPAGADAAAAPSRAPSRARGPWLALLGALVLVAILGAGTYWYFARSAPPAALARGVAAYRAGQREAAKGEFAKAVRDDPTLSLPHVYLGRIARDEGDMATAARELQAAVRLEPRSGVAQREMGSYLLAAGNAALAANFYRRAIEYDPTDSTAQGLYGCTLLQLGRIEAGQRFLKRAGARAPRNCAPVRAPAPQQLPNQPARTLPPS